MITTTNASGVADSSGDRLEQMNLALAELFPKRGPAPLVPDSSICQADHLVLCGVLGGKDVGKSTLINAIADAKVSSHDDEVGRGTTRPVVYVHEEDRDALRHRFGASADPQRAPMVVTHTVEAVRNLALVDLPDFDSTFTEHLEIVRDAVGKMDRVIWICDPKKIADRLWGELLPRVVKDPANVYCVLNKFDLLLRDEPGENGLERAWDRAHAYLSDCLGALKLGNEPAQRFVVSAAFAETDRFTCAVARHWDDVDWRRDPEARPVIKKLADAGRRDLVRLREMINRPIAPARAREIKSANRTTEARVNAAVLRDHYELPEFLSAAESALTALASELETRFDEELIATLADRLAGQGRSEAELADELMTTRVEHWPILGALFWVFRGVVRWLGRKFAPPIPEPREPSDPLRVRGIALEDRLNSLQASIRSRFARLLSETELDRQWPSSADQVGHVCAGFEGLGRQIDNRVLSVCRAECRPPGALAKLCVWLPLFWFPLLQPFAEGLLESVAAQGFGGTLHGLALVVRALGAASILRGLLLVFVLYVAGLAFMYARSIRAVRQARSSAFGEEGTDETTADMRDTLYADGIRRVLADEVFAPLAGPIESRLARLRAFGDELDAIQG